MAGRKPFVPVTPQQFQVLAAALQEAASHCERTAAEMQAGGLKQLLLPASTVLQIYVPQVQAFARKAQLEVGPAITARRLGVQSRTEHNQDRGRRARAAARERSAQKTANEAAPSERTPPPQAATGRSAAGAGKRARRRGGSAG